MKPNYLIAVLFLFASAPLLAANECTSKIFERLQLVEKTSYRIPKLKPSVALKGIMDAYEISCPWQVTQDFNGDHQQDWIGLVQKDKEFILLAYISQAKQYKILEVKHYSKLPENVHYSFMSTQEAALYLKNKAAFFRKQKFVFVENTIEDNSVIYSWDGKTMLNLGEFAGNY